MSTVSLQPSRQHSILFWIIRGTGALLAGASGLAVALIVGGASYAIYTHGATFSFMLLLRILFILLMASLYGVLFKIGHDMFRKVNVATVTSFTFIFSIILARTWYYLLPTHLPKIVTDYAGTRGFLVPFTEPDQYRSVWAFLAFILFYKLIKACLMRVLELNHPSSPRPENPDPSIPEFPKKSPLIQL